MSNINSYIGLTLRKLYKSDLTKKLDKWKKYISSPPKEDELQEHFQDEEFYIYITENKQLYFVSRSSLESGVECYSPYERVIEDEFNVPDFGDYCVKVELDPDWIALEEMSNIGIESTINKEIFDDLVKQFLESKNKFEKYFLLFSAGGSGPDINNEYDSWYDFVKYVKLSEL